MRPLIVPLLALLLSAPATALADGIPWRLDFEAALAEAREARRPVFVDLWATWCAPCKVMDKETYTDPAVIDASRPFVMIKVDVDAKADVAGRFDPDGIPTVVFMDAFGNEIARHEGMMDAGRLRTLLGQVPHSFAAAPASLASLGANPDDHGALMEAGRFYVSEGAYPAALVYYERASGTSLAQRDAAARTDTALAVGTTLMSLDAPEHAEQVFRTALKKCDRTREPLVRLGLADALAKQGKDRDAIRAYGDVIKRYPNTDNARAAASRMKELSQP